MSIYVHFRKCEKRNYLKALLQKKTAAIKEHA